MVGDDAKEPSGLSQIAGVQENGFGTRLPRPPLASLMPKRRRRKSADPFTLGLDAWLLGAEAMGVIAQRSALIALGGAKAQLEAERMVAEKVVK